MAEFRELARRRGELRPRIRSGELTAAEAKAIVEELEPGYDPATVMPPRRPTGGLWRNQDGTPEGKYLVLRRDGTVPPWPWFVLGAGDEAAVDAVLAYADKGEALGYDPQYVQDLRVMAVEWEAWRRDHGKGYPDAVRHRVDDPETVARMARGQGA
jgi:hypothetical protein